MSRFMFLIFALLAAASTVHAAPQVPDPSKGLVVVTVRLPPVHLARYYVNIVQVATPDGSKPSTDDFDLGDGWVTNFSSSYERHEFDELPPGDYQIINVNFDSGRTHYVVCLGGAPSRFQVRAGAAIYLGEFVLRPTQSYGDGPIGPPLEYNNGNLASAQAALAKKYTVPEGALMQADLAVASVDLRQGECRK